MRIPGRRVTQTRLVQKGRFVVAVDVELVIPPDDPSEPCLESETVNFLKEVSEYAERGDRSWLAQHGKVYELVAAAFLLPSVRRAREPARRSQCKNNLKQIALALHNYHDRYQAFPPAFTVDADGKPLHSWRTLILPYMDQTALYDKIDLTKPWDDPANAEVFKLHHIEAYRCPSEQESATHTTYLTVVTSNSCLRPRESARLSDIKDGLSNTLMVTEVDSEHAVPWMAPIDADESLFLAISPTSKLVHTGGVQAAFADGSVRFLNASLSAEIRRALISIDGNESLTDY